MKRFVSALSLAAALSLPGLAYAAGAPEPKDFVVDAIKGDNSEILLGQLAQSRGASEGVRDFGMTLVNDHAKAKQEFEALAKSMQMMPPADPKPEAREEHDKLAQLSGAAFDRAFINGMVEDHEKDIALFQSVADAKNNAASGLAAKQLPTLKKHLQIAQALQKGMPPANL